MSRYAPWRRWNARMLRGEHFVRPSVHNTVNFSHKASPAREVERFVFEREFSHPTLDAHASLPIWPRIDMCVVPLAEPILRPFLDWIGDAGDAERELHVWWKRKRKEKRVYNSFESPLELCWRGVYTLYLNDDCICFITQRYIIMT